MNFYKVLENVEKTVQNVIIQKNKTILKLKCQMKDLQKELLDQGGRDRSELDAIWDPDTRLQKLVQRRQQKKL